MTEPSHIELTEQFELYKFNAGKYILGEQLFWVSNLLGYTSIAFICPFCGRLWARRRLYWFDIQSKPATWVACLRLCEAHGGGSLLDQGDFNHIDTMPRGLMEYELSIFKGA